MDVSIKPSLLIAFLSVVSVSLAFVAADDASNQLHFWQTMLPSTPMPHALREALPKMNTDDQNEESHQNYSGQVTLSDTLNCPMPGYRLPSPPEFLQQDFITSLFFLEKDIIPGTKLNIRFKSHMQGLPFPSTQMVRKLPKFTSKNLPQLLQFFSVNPNSESAETMNHTVGQCEHPDSVNGRIQFCSLSLENMVTRVISELHSIQNIKAVSMPSIHDDSVVPYVIKNVRQVAAERSVIVCHKPSFPVGLYYCHQPRGVAAYTVSLVRQQDKVKVDTYAICHYHTSDWSPEYIALKALGVPPGTSVCHFVERDVVIWYQS